MNRTVLVILAACIFAACGSQPKSDKKTIYTKKFNWTIVLPPGFDTVSAAEWRKLQNKGEEALEKTTQADIQNNSNTIFVLRSDKFNYIEANYQDIDQEGITNYAEDSKGVNDILYQTMKDNTGGKDVDSSTTRETIDGIDFNLFILNVQITKDVSMELRMYSHLFGTSDMTVSLATINTVKRKVLLNALRTSTFK